MRIIHIVNEPFAGGAELLVRELNYRLRMAGVDSCALFLTNPRGVDLGSSEYCLNLPSARSIRAPRRIRQFLEQYSGDRVIVHAHLTYPLYYLALMRRPSNAVLIYTEHNTHNRRRGVAALRPIERYVYSRFDAIACISEGVRASLLDWLGHDGFEERVTTVLNGARLFGFVPDRWYATRDLSVISLGSLTTKKGLDIALEAVSLVPEVVGRYLVVGQGPERDRLARKAQRLGIDDRVTFAGSQVDVEFWLRKADLMLVPSRWEGFGLVAVEALSMGLPVVASNVSGLREILGDCEAAVLVEPGEARAMADAIRAYASKVDDEKVRIAEQARTRAEAYGLDAMTTSYMALYERLMAE